MVIHESNGVLNTLSGTDFATLYLAQGLMNTIAISPATSTTTYDVILTNSYGFKVFVALGVEGEYSEVPDIVFSEALTLTVENASQDEEFEFYTSFIEQYV